MKDLFIPQDLLCLSGNELKVLFYKKNYDTQEKISSQIADFLGLSRATYYNCLKSLKEKGYIQ